jgi:hypothetical protein
VGVSWNGAVDGQSKKTLRLQQACALLDGVRVYPAVAVFLSLVACTGGNSGPSSSLPSTSGAFTRQPDCGAVSKLAHDPGGQGSGLRVGPLWLRGFIHESGPAVILLQPWYPTKVLIAHGRIPNSSVELRGISCSTGQALHFCYGDPCISELGGTSTDPATLAAAGVAVQTVPLGVPGDYTGYMLFTAPGTYQISATRDGQPVGEVIVMVRHH